MIPNIGHFGKGKTVQPVKRSVVAEGWGAGDGHGEHRIFRAVKLFCVILYWWVDVPICLCRPAECAQE